MDNILLAVFVTMTLQSPVYKLLRAWGEAGSDQDSNLCVSVWQSQSDTDKIVNKATPK